MNKRYNNILKGIWFTMFILCTGLGIMHTIRDGIERSYIFFIFAAIAIVLFLVRHHWGKKYKNQ